MNCPVCSKEITKHYIATDLAWCDECRVAYSYDSLDKGDPEAIVQLPEDGDRPKGISYSIGKESETIATRSFSFLGIPLALLSAFWLFVTLFSFTIHIGLAILMALVCLVLFLVTYTTLACRLSVTFYPQTGEIVYAKGPFTWLSIRRRFNGKDVVEVREGALIAAEGDLPRPVVFLKNDKSIMLDFSKNETKREFLELVLCVFIARA